MVILFILLGVLYCAAFLALWALCRMSGLQQNRPWDVLDEQPVPWISTSGNTMLHAPPPRLFSAHTDASLGVWNPKSFRPSRRRWEHLPCDFSLLAVPGCGKAQFSAV